MSQQGYFVISDISGYTAFLTQSELEHAHKALGMLFESLTESFKSPLTISNFQGDAILSYTPDGSEVTPTFLFNTVENIYRTFIQRREFIFANRTCDCRACHNIPSLDLKLFVHHGEYAVSKFLGKEELSGKDVIIAHRMMKNEVREKTGIHAYALFSEAALDVLASPERKAAMLPYAETYDHIGEVKMFICDLEKIKKSALEPSCFD